MDIVISGQAQTIGSFSRTLVIVLTVSILDSPQLSLGLVFRFVGLKRIKVRSDLTVQGISSRTISLSFSSGFRDSRSNPRRENIFLQDDGKVGLLDGDVVVHSDFYLSAETNSFTVVAEVGLLSLEDTSIDLSNFRIYSISKGLDLIGSV